MSGVLKRMAAQAMVALLAVGLGTALTNYSIRGGDAYGAVTLGGWTAYPDSGTPEADPYSKSRLARDAALSLGAAEGVIFYADQDADGSPLSASCDYLLEGISPPARFWTLHAVKRNREQFGASNPELPQSLHSGMIAYGADEHFQVHISSRAKSGNWLAIAPEGGFSLAFSLYDSPVATNKGLIETTFPTLTQAGCRG